MKKFSLYLFMSCLLYTSQPEYETTQAYKDAVTQYENIKATCVEYPLEEVTHVFFHTLIVDTSKAFDGDSDEAGYNQMMTTVSEFNKIMQSMYCLLYTSRCV